MTEQLKPTAASELRRRRQPYTFQASPTLTVQLRRVDMQTLLMEGLLPLTLLDAAERFEKLGERFEKDKDKSSSEIMQGSDPDDMKRMMDFIRHYACVVVVDPKLTLVDDGDENSVPVDSLSSDELLAIWNAVPPEEKEVPKVTNDEAREFRGAAEPTDVQAPQAVESVRPTPKLVDTDVRKRIHA